MSKVCLLAITLCWCGDFLEIEFDQLGIVSIWLFAGTLDNLRLQVTWQFTPIALAELFGVSQ